jgi:hypothetical protein
MSVTELLKVEGKGLAQGAYYFINKILIILKKRKKNMYTFLIAYS